MSPPLGHNSNSRITSTLCAGERTVAEEAGPVTRQTADPEGRGYQGYADRNEQGEGRTEQHGEKADGAHQGVGKKRGNSSRMEETKLPV